MKMLEKQTKKINEILKYFGCQMLFVTPYAANDKANKVDFPAKNLFKIYELHHTCTILNEFPVQVFGQF